MKPLPPELVDRAAWAMAELRNAQLHDPRRTERLVAITASLAEHPTSSIPDAMGSWAAAKAAYRFFDNDAVTPEAILTAHRSSTIERFAGRPLILAVQDTTVVNLATHTATEGLGPTMRRIVDSTGKEHSTAGFFVHSCLAVSPDGVPLGLLSQYVWARSADKPKRKGAPQLQPIEEKESFRWLTMLKTSTTGIPAGTRVLTVADREADITEFLSAAVTEGKEILVRAARDHLADNPEGYLWAAAEAAPVVGHLRVEVPRAPGKRARTAELELRIAQVTLRHSIKKIPPFTLRTVLAKEVAPPSDDEAVEWLLLTTLDVKTEEDAATCVYWYTQRWKIERFHYTLKSGCHLEELQLETLERLQRALAIYSIVAWRLLYLTHMARTGPTEPCTSYLTDVEWKALHCRIHRTPTAPENPPDIQTAILWIARLGGFLARKSDGAPGVKVLWRGLRRLEDIVEMWEIYNPSV